MARKAINYAKINLSEEEIEAESYKAYFGGGAKAWEERGEFQLELLRKVGMTPECKLLDVGCGPLRAGIHFLRFLRFGSYRGIDSNSSFISSAHALLRKHRLADRAEHILHLEDFAFKTLRTQFDFILCFSVLNHCTTNDQHLFFEQVPDVMHGESKLIISHGRWLKELSSFSKNLKLVCRIASEADLGMTLRDWGFQGVRSHAHPFPILVLAKPGL